MLMCVVHLYLMTLKIENCGNCGLDNPQLSQYLVFNCLQMLFVASKEKIYCCLMNFHPFIVTGKSKVDYMGKGVWTPDHHSLGLPQSHKVGSAQYYIKYYCTQRYWDFSLLKLKGLA